MKLRSLYLLPFLLFDLVYAVSTFNPARPPAIPLAVKSPYLTTWQFAGSDRGNGGYLAGQWPTFWNGLANFGTGRITGWTGLIRVDGTSYVWMGAPNGVGSTVQQTAFTYTSTRSTFTMSVAGKVQMTIDFLSPVYPNDLKRQSLEFSYMDVAVTSLDGNAHNVQIYTDVSGEWASGSADRNITWAFGSSGFDVVYHQFQAVPQLLYSQNGASGSQQAEWGTWYYATNFNTNLSFTQDADNTARTSFANNGKLNSQSNNNFRAINDHYPVFAWAQDFGSVGKGSNQHQTFTIGRSVQSPIQFDDGTNGLKPQPALWTSYFQSQVDSLAFFMNDFGTANSAMTSLDNQVATDSKNAGGQDYLTITSLSVRQAFGGLVLANTASDPYLWLKEISSDGNMQTVDVIFPTTPILYYFNSTLVKYLLKPLFLFQESGAWPASYCIHDLGFLFPNATGHTDPSSVEMQEIEESGNMIIMALAYAQKTGDNDFLSQHYTILAKWASYLIVNCRIPGNAFSTDDFQGRLANQTNLALKGMIGIKAMSQIATLTSHTADAPKYNTIATRYINDFHNNTNGVYAVNYNANPPHTTLAYQSPDTYGLLYNLYSDRLLKLNFVSQDIYDIQSTFYASLQSQYKYGVPLDSRNKNTKLDWECWVASIASTNTRSTFYSKLATWINQTPTNEGLTDLYLVDTGDYTGHFSTRPVVGGTFAQLAL